MKDNGRSGCVDIAGYIGWSVVRTRAIVAEMNEIEAISENVIEHIDEIKYGSYRLKFTSDKITCTSEVLQRTGNAIGNINTA